MLFALFAAFAFALAMGVVAPGVVTFAYADDLTAPANSKTLVANGDGTYDLSLSVTGRSETSSSSSKADVIVVLDLSDSMNDWQDRSTRLAIAKSAVNRLAQELLSNNTAENPDAVSLSLVTFNNYATTRIERTTDLGSFQRTVNGLRATSGTNWEDALQMANGITAREDADTYVVFVSDGDPTFRNTRGVLFSPWAEDERHSSNGHVYYGSGNSDNNGRNYRYAREQADAITDAGKTLYSIGVFGNVSNMKKLAADAGQSDNYYSADDQQALADAFEDIVNQISHNLSYTGVSINDGLTSLTSTTLVEGEASGFTYTKTVDGIASSWVDAPAARYDGSSVSWDLSSVGSLENGVTYTVTFKVHPSQMAIDTIAQLENGTMTLAEANARYGDQFVQAGDGSFGLKTNTAASVAFTQTRTTTTNVLPDDAVDQGDGTWSSASTGLTYTYDSATDRYVGTVSESGSATMSEPDPLPVSTPTIGVSKAWVDSLDESVRPAGDISFDVMLDGATKLATVTLNAANGYRADVHVPYGITAGDVDLTSGHYVTLVETNLDSHYEFTTETVRPMLVDGNLVLGGDGDSVVAGTNTLKGRIAVTKQAEGDSYPADATFGYDIAVNVSSGTETLPYTVYAADGTTVVTSGSFTTGGTVTLTIGVGQKIVIDSVPLGATYSVIESSSPAGWSFVSAGDTGGSSTVSGSTVTGTVISGNAQDAITYTNRFTPAKSSPTGEGNLTVTKQLTGRDLAVGQFSFALAGVNDAPLPADTTVANDANGAVSFGTIAFDKVGTYRYTLTEVQGSAPGYTYDGAEYTLVATVSKNADTGALEVAWSVEGSADKAVVFANSYAASGGTDITATKTLTGRAMTAGEFSFAVTNAAGDDVARAKSPAAADGQAATVDFGTFSYSTAQIAADVARGVATKNADGSWTYAYNAHEDVSALPGGVTAAASSFDFTVTVVDNGDGTLTATPTYPTSASGTAGIAFANTYGTDTTQLSLIGAKNLTVPEGLTGPGDISGKYTFTLTGAEGAPMPDAATATNEKSGTVSFGPITFDKAGTYTYTVTESGTVSGVTNDAAAETGKAVTVKVTDDGAGHLSAAIVDAGGTPIEGAAFTFTNAYSAQSATASVSAAKVLTVPEGLTGPGDIGGKFTFTLTRDTADAPLPATTQVANPDGNGTAVSFGAITFTAPGTYVYRVTESGAVDGVTNDAAAKTGKTVAVTVTDNGEGALVASAADAVTFTNVYSAREVTLDGDSSLQVTKDVEGHDAANGFSFTLTPQFDLAGSGVIVPDGATTAATGAMAAGASKTLSFGALSFAKPGEYAFSITEDGSDGDGWTCDERSHEVTVSVTDDGKGRLVAAVSGNNPTVTNTYRAGSVTLDGKTALFANKTVVGHDSAEDYAFTLTPDFAMEGSGVSYASGADVAKTSGAIAEGDTARASFGAITFTKAGTFPFIVKETAGSAPGWSYSDETAVITVTVTDNGAGQLVAAVEGNGPTFTNTYTTENVTLTGDTALQATKAVKGYDGTEPYTFALTLTNGDTAGASIVEGGGTASTAGAIADGSSRTVSFGDVTFSKVGTYTFSVKEQTGSKAGWTYDSASHEIAVVVTDNGKGKLEAAVTGNNPTFTNTYQAAASDPLTLTATKTLTGTTLMAGEFSFELRDANGALVSSASNKADGSIAFDPLTFDKPGTYTYTMSEVKGSLSGITYDGETHSIVVTATDNGSGKLSAAITQGAAPVFANSYASTSNALVLTAQKVLEGRALADGQFSFQLYDAQGNPVGAAVTNNAAGSISFPQITFTQDDFAGITPAADGSRTKQFAYTAKELAGQQPGYTYATDAATYTVTAVDKGDGTIEATVDSARGTTFTNTYAATPVTATPFAATKTLEGRAMNAGEFTFQLANALGAVIQTATNAADGSVAFEPLTYQLSDLGGAVSKTFSYTIAEVGNGLGGIAYDTAVHTVSVTVTDNGDGTLSVSAPDYDTREAPTFANTYTVAPAAVELPTVAKVVSGDTPETYPDFSFTVEALDGAPAPAGADGAVQTRTLKGPGTVSFGSVTFTAAGTYSYRVSETAGDAGGWTYDANAYTVTYKVADKGDGTFSVEQSIAKGAAGEPADAIAFQNSYATPAVPSEPDSPDEPTAPAEPAPKAPFAAPATGDALPVALVAIVAVGAGAVAVGAAAKRRRAQAGAHAGRGAHRR